MNIENIHIGDKLVILGRRTDVYDPERTEVYGAPAAVVAICAPYIAIRAIASPRVVRTVDTRIWLVTKCSEDYAAAFAESAATGASEPTSKQTNCPVCGEGRFLRSYIEGLGPTWKCSVCESTVIEATTPKRG